MKVFLLRHAEAAYGVADPLRPLTPAGRSMAADLAEFVRDKPFFEVDAIWCSPYRRARETAAPFEAAFPDAPLRVIDELTPESDPEWTRANLLAEKQSILLVGHNPHLSLLARSLICAGDHSVPLSFKKAGLMALRRDGLSPSGFSLAAWLPPAAIGLKV